MSKPLRSRSRSLFLLPLAAFAGLAHAHGGGDHVHTGLLAGFLHPLTGVDHLAAMLAVGFWSALAVRPAWAAPAAFVGVLSLGALAGFAGVPVPAVEPMIAASLLVLGLLVAMRRGMPLAAAAGLAGAFAFFHGAAHGSELAGGAALAGMVLATAALHALGITLGRLVLARHPGLSRAAGAIVALSGVAMLARLA